MHDHKESRTANQDLDFDTDGEYKSSKAPLSAITDLLQDLYARMTTHGYEMVPTLSGNYCGHCIYFLSDYPVKGISAPPEFKFKKQVQPNDSLEHERFIARLYKVIDYERSNADHKSVADLWLQIYKDFRDNMGDTRSQTYKSAQGHHKENYQTIALNGEAGAYKVIPPRSWFPEAVQKIDARSLLSLLPDTEARAFMLHLGRVVAGSSGHPLVNGKTLTHTYRSYCILVGQTAGMGKSTLLNYLISGLRKAGYTVSQINSDLNKFGWGPIALSDMAMIDDLTDETQKKLLTDVRVKSIVSNGEMKVEEKGIPAADIKAKTAIVGCTNMTNYSHFIGMDNGSISRTNQLYTFNEGELIKRWGTDRDYKTLPYWSSLSKQLKVSTDVLALWLFRVSMEMFLDEIGYNLKAEQVAESRLYETVQALRDGYIIDVNLKHVTGLLDTAKHLLVLALARSGNPAKYERILEQVHFDDYYLVTVARLLVETKGNDEMLPMKYVAKSCIKPIKAKISEFKDLGKIKTVSGAFETVIREFISDKTFGFPQKMTAYAPYWENNRREAPYLAENCEVKLPQYSPVAGAVQAIQERLDSFLND